MLLSSRSVQRVYDPPADGSCFFHCIVKKLDLLKANSQNYTHLTLRRQTIGKQDTYATVYTLVLNPKNEFQKKNILEWLKDHLNDYKDFIDQEDHEKYLSKMKKTDEWVDNLIIQVSGRVFSPNRFM